MFTENSRTVVRSRANCHLCPHTDIQRTHHPSLGTFGQNGSSVAAVSSVVWTVTCVQAGSFLRLLLELRWRIPRWGTTGAEIKDAPPPPHPTLVGARRTISMVPALLDQNIALRASSADATSTHLVYLDSAFHIDSTPSTPWNSALTKPRQCRPSSPAPAAS